MLRSNCIDCLDRTNVAQFFLSFTVVYRMLFALGIEFSPDTPDTSPLQRILVEMCPSCEGSTVGTRNWVT